MYNTNLSSWLLFNLSLSWFIQDTNAQVDNSSLHQPHDLCINATHMYTCPLHDFLTLIYVFCFMLRQLSFSTQSQNNRLRKNTAGHNSSINKCILFCLWRRRQNVRRGLYPHKSPMTRINLRSHKTTLVEVPLSTFCPPRRLIQRNRGRNTKVTNNSILPIVTHSTVRGHLRVVR